MASATIATPACETLADLLDRLGNVPANRIRMKPAPGTATVADVIEIHDRTNRLFELVEGVLVEKAMGFFESRLAAALIEILGSFVSEHDLGIVLAPDGMMQLAPGLVRMPDVSFLSWDRFPDRRPPTAPIPELSPDLAVEVLSKSNTPGEMDRKLRDYFDAGVKLVWYLDAEARTAMVYTAVDEGTAIAEDGMLDGGNVLPGFSLAVQDWYERAWQRR